MPQNQIQFQHGMSLSEFSDDLKGTTLAAWAKLALHPTVHLVTNGLASFAAAGALVAAHGSIIVSPHKSSELEPFRWVNTFIANAKTAIMGPTIMSMSTNTIIATWLRPSTGSTAS
jgi:hypothetical protein